MTAVWSDGPDGKWEVLRPSGIALERDLEEMVFLSIGMLPLSGSPPAVVALARQVVVSPTGHAVDIVGAENDGRVVLIEVKLKQNPETRRAIVAQLLSYAAALKGWSAATLLERLAAKGFEGTIAGAISEVAPVQETDFDAALETNLTAGRFRLVLVLDEVPDELITLVGYLQDVSQGLLSIDLIKVSVYRIEGRTIAVPQRIDPQTHTPSQVAAPDKPATQIVRAGGTDMFAAAIDDAPMGSRTAFEEMLAWATQLENEHLTSLISSRGARRTILTIPVFGEDRGLISLWNDSGVPYVWVHGSVISRRAPNIVQQLESLVGRTLGPRFPVEWGEVTSEFREVIASGYREALTNK